MQKSLLLNLFEAFPGELRVLFPDGLPPRMLLVSKTVLVAFRAGNARLGLRLQMGKKNKLPVGLGDVERLEAVLGYGAFSAAFPDVELMMCPLGWSVREDGAEVEATRLARLRSGMAAFYARHETRYARCGCLSLSRRCR